MTTPTFTPEAISAAQSAARRYGCPASVTLAQYLIESSCGRYEPPGSNNPFGIKARPGEPFVTAMTTEYENGVPVRKEQNFCKYANLETAFTAHAYLFYAVPLYHDALAHKYDPDAFVRLMAPHYATAPTYASSILQAMLVNDLYQYDIRPEPPAVASTSTSTSTTVFPALQDPHDRRIWIQTFLNAHAPATRLTIDGALGPETEAALVAYLQRQG